MEVLEGRRLLANAGSLDPTFGAAGEVFTPYTGPYPRIADSFPQTIGVDAAAGNKILVARVITIIGGEGQFSGPVQRYQVERLNLDGSVDTTFGTNGVATLALPSGDSQDDGSSKSIPAAVFATSTGQIDVVGSLDNGKLSEVDAFIAALNPDGSPVSSFGTNGVSVLPTPNFRIVAAMPQGDGVLILGNIEASGTFMQHNDHAAVLRATAAGQLDRAFNGFGVVYLTVSLPGVGDYFDHAVGFGADGQGRIVVAARTQAASQAEVFRLNSSGQFDPTFAGTGAETLPANTFFAPTAVAVQPDGKVVLTGSAASTPGSTAVSATETLRLNADGTVDTSHTFDKTTQPLDVVASAIQPDGKILLAGKAGTTPAGGLSSVGGPYAVVRLNADLTPDTTFGAANNGEATLTDPNQDGGRLNALVVDPTGNILVAGNNVAYSQVVNGTYTATGGSLFARLLGAATATTVPTVDLFLSQTTSSPVARYGQIELFDVTITNRSTIPVPGVVVSDFLPANVVLLNVGPTQGTVRSVINGQAIVDIGTLAPGASASVIVVVVPNATGPLVNSAGASAALASGIPSINLSQLGVLAVDGPVVQGVARAGNGSSAVVSFDEALDPTSARQRANYRVVDLGLRSRPSQVSRTVSVRSVTYATGSRTVQINTAGRLNPTHAYALVLGGSKPRGLLDASGRRIVGNGSGLTGSTRGNPF